jgi:hypothetical protein
MRIMKIVAVGSLMLIAGLAIACKQQRPDDYEKKLHCLTLAERTLRDKRNMVASEKLIAEGTQVGYSDKRGSCIAMFAISDAAKGSFREYEVLKLPSGDSLITSICSAKRGYVCVDPKPLAIANEVYQEAMDNRYGPPPSAVYRTPDRPDDTSLYTKSEVTPPGTH